MQIGQSVRPRRELLDWVDELGDLPVDPEHGPACYVAVQTFDDGTTAVCVTASHVIGDGVGGMMAIFEAISGMVRDTGYDAPGARTPSKAFIADIRQVVRDFPMTASTTAKAIRMVRAKRAEFARARAARGAGSGGRLVRVPSVVLFVDTQDWDSRAECLSGNSYSLFAGFAAKLAERLGRRRSADGAVTLLIAINQRENLDDDRAIAMAFANAVVDPDKVTVDLTDARAAVRDAREKAKQETDPVMELLPLIPWLPKGAVKGVADLMFAYSEDLPVSCSNLGDLPSEIAQADGTPAEYVFIRGLDTNVTEAELQRSHGQLVLVSGRIRGKISISIEGYQLGVENSKERLRGLVAETLSEFGLTGVIE